MPDPWRTVFYPHRYEYVILYVDESGKLLGHEIIVGSQIVAFPRDYQPPQPRR
ncbi:hypothetical protein C7458_10228 [Williamsia muralis]|nr:hypothetical protein C7458_10228 [Williamsia marianensis]